MEIDLSLLHSNTVEDIDISGTYELDKSYYENTDIKNLSKINLDGKVIRKENEEYELDDYIECTITGEMTIPDSITLNDVNYPFTIEYDEQLKSEDVAYIRLKPSDTPDLAKDDITRQAQEFLENLPNFDAFVDFKNGDKYAELRNALFKAAIEDVTADITVNYTDGTSTTHTIAFTGKYDEIDGGTMPVEVTFVSELSPEEKAIIKKSSEV